MFTTKWVKSLISMPYLTESKIDYMPGSAGDWSVSHCSHEIVSYRCLFDVSLWIIILKILLPFITICFCFRGVLLSSDQQERVAERNLNLMLTSAKQCNRTELVCSTKGVLFFQNRSGNHGSSNAVQPKMKLSQFFCPWQSLKNLEKCMGIEFTWMVILPNVFLTSSFLNHMRFLYI